MFSRIIVFDYTPPTIWITYTIEDQEYTINITAKDNTAISYIGVYIDDRSYVSRDGITIKINAKINKDEINITVMAIDIVGNSARKILMLLIDPDRD